MSLYDVSLDLCPWFIAFLFACAFVAGQDSRKLHKAGAERFR